MNYSEIKALNFSSLKRLAVAPLWFRHCQENPEPDKPAFSLGRAAHCLILEPHLFDSRFAIFGGVRNGGKWDAWQEEHPGIESLKPHEKTTAEGIAAAIRANRDVAPLLGGGLYEEPIQWVDRETGLACKGRVDYLRPTQLVDLKTTVDIATAKFSRDAGTFLYHGQMAFYWEGLVTCGRLPPDADRPFIVVVEKKPPYDCGVYRMTVEAMTAGVQLYRSLIRRFEECTAANFWPGKLSGINDLNIPTWAAGSQTETEEEF